MVQGDSTGDTPLVGVQITLSNSESTITDTTSISGVYEFTNLIPASYTITETDPSGYLSSGDFDGVNDNIITVTLLSSQIITGRDFFDYRPVTITGTVHEDTDGEKAQPLIHQSQDQEWLVVALVLEESVHAESQEHVVTPLYSLWRLLDVTQRLA